jgi:hypothetical protein
VLIKDGMTNFAVVGQSVYRKDAIGVRIRDLPITAEQILRVLAEKDGASVAKD